METVGVRELKSNLSRYLKKVKIGKRIIITDRNKEVAILSPFGSMTLEDKLLQMAGQGLIRWSGSKPIGIRDRITSSGGKVSEAVLEDRR